MASGYLNVSTSNGYVSGQIQWSSSTDVNSNTSTVTATLYLNRTNTGYTTYGSGTFYLTINGNQTSNSQQFSISYGSNTVMVSHTVPVSHESDGSKSITISASGSISGAGLSMSTQSCTAVLDTIPRASTIWFPSLDIGTDIPVTITRASSSFTHTIQYYIGDTIIAERRGVGASYTLSLSSAEQDKIYQLIPGATVVTATLWCLTYNGSTVIGDWTYDKASAYVPSSIVPTFTTITHSEANTTIFVQPSGTLSTIVGKYVQGVSKLNMAITGATGAKYSTISSYQISFEGVNYNGSSSISNVIKGGGELTITGTVTDSRGRMASKSITISVLPYSMPVITEFSLSRCKADGVADELGTYVKVISKGSVTSLLNSTERNNLTYTIYTKARTAGSAWVAKKTATITGLSLNVLDIVGTFLATDSADFRIDIKDKFNTTMSLNVLPTGQITMSWSKQGIGAGKVWERGALDVGGNIYANAPTIYPISSSQKIYENLIDYYSSAATVTGICKITLPKSWSSTMMYLKIRGYSYDSMGAWSLSLGGYNYSGGNWINCSASVDSMCPVTQVRFAHDGTKCCILLGSTTTVWNYPRLFIEQFIASFGNIDGWEKGWSISYITSETGIVNNTTITLETPWSNRNSSLVTGSSGYTKLPNGLMLSWGTIGSLAQPRNGTWTEYNFHYAFPNAVFAVVGSANYTGNLMSYPTFQGITTGRYRVYGPNDGGTITELWYFAIGC